MLMPYILYYIIYSICIYSEEKKIQLNKLFYGGNNITVQ